MYSTQGRDIDSVLLKLSISGLLEWFAMYIWRRTPFAMVNSACTLVRAMREVIRRLADFTMSYVDKVAVYTIGEWKAHLIHIPAFLSDIRVAGFTLNLKKTYFAEREVVFVGHVIGSGRRRADSSNNENQYKKLQSTFIKVVIGQSPL